MPQLWLFRRWLRLIRPSSSGRSGPSDRPLLVLITPLRSYRLAPFMAAAQSLQTDLLVVSHGQQALISGALRGVHVDFEHPRQARDRVLQALDGRPVAGVVATDDATVELAAELGRILGLPHNPVQAVRLSRRKDLARARLREAGLPTPEHRLLTLGQALAPQVAGFPLPAVLKPLHLSGSRGVIRVDDLPALEAACARIAALLPGTGSPFEQQHLLLERYLPGEEVAMDGLLDAGCLQTLALFDKPEPLEGPFFEESYYITPSRLPEAMQERIRQRVEQACRAYGLVRGPIHAELRLYRGEAWLLEVAARTIGGQCGRLLRFGTGLGLEELVVAHHLGRESSLGGESGAVGVLMIPIPRHGILRRVEGVLEARKVPHVTDLEISVREGYELRPLPEGQSYLGFIFARGERPGQVERALREAHGCLNIVTAPLLASAPVEGRPVAQA